MANIQSAKKRIRSSEKRRVGNLSAKTKVKTGRRKTHDALAEGSAETAGQAVRDYSSVLDKAVKRGVIKRTPRFAAKSGPPKRCVNWRNKVSRYRKQKSRPIKRAAFFVGQTSEITAPLSFDF